MPYTLTKGLGWFLLALLVGMVVGWLLRSIAATRQMRRLRAVRSDHSELDRMRARNANLEPLVAERDRLATELAALKAASIQSSVVQSVEHVPDPSDIAVAEGEIAAAAADDAADSQGSVDSSIEPATEEPADTGTDTGTDVARSTVDEPSTDPGASASMEPVEFTELNLVAAAAVIGKKIKLDDLTVLEGIGPATAGLCNKIGIHTWADLAATEVSLLRTMLADAGARYQKHDPDSWPPQAGFLAAGHWEEFMALTEPIRGGTAPE